MLRKLLEGPKGAERRCRAAATVETLEPRLMLAAEPSNYDQYVLELINRARANPSAEAALYGISLNEGVDPADTISTAVHRQPLAFDTSLIQAARDHSTWMLANDVFQHEGPGGNSFTERMAAAGYAFRPPWGAGENIAWEGITPPSVINTLVAAGELHQMLFVDHDYPGRGHRLNILDADFSQVGIGLVTGVFDADQKRYNACMITEDFAYQQGNPILTGVVYDDRLVTGDDFYTPGEGLGSVVVTAQSGGHTYSTTTWASGGYSLPLPAGRYTVTFSGGTLDRPYEFTNVVIGAYNVKLDFLLDRAPVQPNMPDLVGPAGPPAVKTIYARPGEPVTIAASVANVGKGKALATFEVAIYRSDDTLVTSDDVKVASYQVPGLVAGSTAAQAVTFIAPLVPGTYYLAVRADAGDVITEAYEDNNWSSTVTLMVGEPDLEGSFTSVTLPDVMVPGDKGSARVLVVNNGRIPAAGPLTVKIYASHDGTGPDDQDVLLTTLSVRKINLVPGGQVALSGAVNITYALPQGSWRLLAQIDPDDAIQEDDEADNVFATGEVRDLRWLFGDFEGRKGVKLTVRDAAGAMVTFALTGGGWGEVSGGPEFASTVLHETTSKSAFSVTTAARKTTLGAIQALGHVKSIKVKGDITGDVEIKGGIAALTLGDVNPPVQSRIRLHTDPAFPIDPKLKLRAAIALGSVHDCSIDAGDVPIRSMTTVGWLDNGGDDDELRSLAVDKLTVKSRKANAKAGIPASAGHLAADLHIADALGTASIAGDVTGLWQVPVVRSLTIGGSLLGAELTITRAADPAKSKVLTLGKLTVDGWIRDSRIISSGHVGTVTAGGIWDSDVYAGLDPVPPKGVLADPATDLLPDVYIKSLTVKGSVKDSGRFSTINANIAAYSLLSVSLCNALPTATPARTWGIAYHVLGSYTYKDAGVSYRWWSGSVDPYPTQPAGSFAALPG